MIHTSGRRLLCFALFSASFLTLSPFASAQWTAPTPEELSMTSQPQAPGAAAVYLYREEKTDDPDQTYSEYVRLKILTEGGKDLANVELKYISEGYTNYSVDNIAGRTIHPDGTVIPFSGKQAGSGCAAIFLRRGNDVRVARP
jgi:hypothetical protein